MDVKIVVVISKMNINPNDISSILVWIFERKAHVIQLVSFNPKKTRHRHLADRGVDLERTLPRVKNINLNCL